MTTAGSTPPTAPAGKRLRKRWTTALWVVLGTVGVALAVRALGRAGLAELYHAVAHADARLVSLATLLALAQLVCKSERWRLMLAPIAKLPSLKLHYYLILSFGASMLLPTPSGAVLRVYALRRRHDVPAPESTAIIVAEKLFEGIGLMLLVAPLPLLLVLPPSLTIAVIGLTVFGLVTAVLAVLLARRALRSGWTGRWARYKRLAPAAVCVTRPRIFIAASALSFLSHVVNCVVIVCLFEAVGVHVPVAASALVVLVLAVALIVPITPGHAVTLEAGAVAALALVGVRPEPALAFGLTYHAVHLVPVALVLLTGLGLLSDARRNQPALSVLRAEDTPVGTTVPTPPAG